MELPIPNQITLIINDTVNNITIDCLDKSILKSSCLFFKNMLTSFKEESQTEITIIVPKDYGFITKDIIMTFFGEELDMTKLADLTYSQLFLECHDYLSMSINKKYLNHIIVNDTNFGLLLRLFALDNYDATIVKFIEKNMPKELDIKNLDKKLIGKILELNPTIILSHGININLFDVGTGKIIKTIEQKDFITKAIFSPDGSSIALADKNGRDVGLSIFDTDTGLLVQKFNNIKYRSGQWEHIGCLAFSSDGKRIAAGTNELKIWDVKTGDLVHTLQYKNKHIKYYDVDAVKDVSFSDNGKMIIGLFDSYLVFWDNDTGLQIDKLEIRGVYGFAKCHNMLSYCANDLIRIIDINTGQLIKNISTNSLKKIDCMAFSSTGNNIITTSSGIINIWCIKTCALISSFRANKVWTLQISFSANDKQFLSSGYNEEIQVWDFESINGIYDKTHKVVNNCQPIKIFKEDSNIHVRIYGESYKPDSELVVKLRNMTT